MRTERMTLVRHKAETKSDSAPRNLFKDAGPNALPSKGQAGRRLGYPWQALATNHQTYIYVSAESRCTGCYIGLGFNG
jgi:hypothetical protein